MARQPSITLALASPAELFAAPEFDPWRGQVETMSGVDRLLLELDALPDGEIPHLILQFPATDDIQIPAERAEAALAAYIGSRTERLERLKDRIRRRGIKELLYGLLFLGACFIGAAILNANDLGPDWLTTFLAEGLVIIGWIALWHPGDMLLFERWPLIREQRLLARLQKATVSVEAGGALA